MKDFNANQKFIRHLFEFDQENPKTYSKTTAPELMIRASQLKPVPFPKALAPTPKPARRKPGVNDALPKCDFLAVTWTVAEARALSDILTPGYACKTDWYDYKHNFASFLPKLGPMAPARQSKRLGSYFVTNIGTKSVLCMKSELHMARDGKQMPVLDLWNQLINEVDPQLVISTGTAGGVGSDVVLGDVVVTNQVRFDCLKTFKNQPYSQELFTSSATMITKEYREMLENKLFPANADRLGPEKRGPVLIDPKHPLKEKPVVVTTDFFAFDDSENTFGLQQLGSAVEMGDAVLGLAAKNRAHCPPWLIVRNASDPQIPKGATLEAEETQAGKIYETYGYWTTVDSAIATWAAIASNL